jgi:hypothetical protein
MSWTCVAPDIELPLHAAMDDNAGLLSVNVRELSSLETVKLCVEMAERKSSEIKDVHRIAEQKIAQPTVATP